LFAREVKEKEMIKLIIPAVLLTIAFAIPSAFAQDNGYTMAVSVASHGFGEKSVDISVDTANGFHDSKNVSTQGGASALFNIPAGEGDVKVCANFACTTVSQGTSQVTINGAG
jgi:hypothetical protein